MFTSSRRNGGRSFRPRLEILEDRTVLSDCTMSVLTDTGDKGDLRYCITHATDGDSIQFGVTGAINLTGALPNLAHSISIDGPGANLLTVSRARGGFYRIFTVDRFATVTISGLTITGGYDVSDRGGGGIFSDGQVTIRNCTVFNNTAQLGGGIAGTGTISNSTIVGNFALASGNASAPGGGIFGSWDISNSTIVGNTASGGGAIGGGIWGGGIITSSTISGNLAHSLVDLGAAGGGIYVAGSLSTRNTIVAENHAEAGGDDCCPEIVGNLGSQGHNLIGLTEGGSGFDPSDLLNVFRPLLGPLQDNGGPTRTMALLPGSPAVDAGDNRGAPMWDQRGEGFNRIVGGIIDIGAFEAQIGAAVSLQVDAPKMSTKACRSMSLSPPWMLTTMSLAGTVAQ